MLVGIYAFSKGLLEISQDRRDCREVFAKVAEYLFLKINESAVYQGPSNHRIKFLK